jgi:hypothetical protein
LTLRLVEGGLAKSTRPLSPFSETVWRNGKIAGKSITRRTAYQCSNTVIALTLSLV